MKPLPCPFCGSTKIEVRLVDDGVECLDCGAWMPSVYSSDKSRCHGALEMWNKRGEKDGTERV